MGRLIILPLFFLRWYLFVSFVALLLVSVVVFLGDLVYMVRETREIGLPTLQVVLLSLFRLPELILVDMLPIVVLIGSTLATLRLIRTGVLVVVQSMGYSMWGFLRGPVLGMLLLGLLVTLFLSPVSTLLYNWHIDVLQRYTDDSREVFSNGNLTWFHTQQDGFDLVVRARDIDASSGRISGGLKIVYFREDGSLWQIVEAGKGLVSGNAWQMFDVERKVSGTLESERLSFVFLSDMPRLEELSSPGMERYRIPFFSLPSYIAEAEKLGFKVPLEERRYHLLLSLPILLVVSMLCGIWFASGVHHRNGQVLFPVVMSLVCSVALFFTLRLLSFMALSGLLSGWLSVWGLLVILGGGVLGVLILRYEQ